MFRDVKELAVPAPGSGEAGEREAVTRHAAGHPHNTLPVQRHTAQLK